MRQKSAMQQLSLLPKYAKIVGRKEVYDMILILAIVLAVIVGIVCYFSICSSYEGLRRLILSVVL